MGGVHVECDRLFVAAVNTHVRVLVYTRAAEADVNYSNENSRPT